MFNWSEKRRGHANLSGTIAPEASLVQSQPAQHIAQAKWTSTLTNHLLLETGYNQTFNNAKYAFEPEVVLGLCHSPFAQCPAGTGYGSIPHQDLTLGTNTVAAVTGTGVQTGPQKMPTMSHYIQSSLSYVTGAHNLKIGVQQRFGWQQDIAGRHQRRSDPAVPRRRPHPGHYLQYADRQPQQRGRRPRDLRAGHVDHGTSDAQSRTAVRLLQHVDSRAVGAGRPVRAGAARSRRSRTSRPGRTSRRASARRTTCSATAGQPSKAMSAPTCNRRAPGSPRPTTRWSSRRTSGRGQTRIAMTSRRRASSGRRATGRSASAESESGDRHRAAVSVGLRRRVPARAGARRRRVGQLQPPRLLSRRSGRRTWRPPLSAYTLASVPDPLNIGQTIPIYNLAPEAFGLVDLLDDNSPNNRQYYQGVDVTVNVRYQGATINGGTSTGRTLSVTCDVQDPNNLRFCDQTTYDVPFRTLFRLSGSYALPYGIRASAVFPSVPGARAPADLRRDAHSAADADPGVGHGAPEPAEHAVPRHRQSARPELLEEPSRPGGGVEFRPEVGIFNALNANPVTAQTNAFGTGAGSRDGDSARASDPRRR